MIEQQRAFRQAGFTLVEAILVITIGAILLTSGTMLYQQYRQSAGDSAAFDRVVAFQSMVEQLYAANGRQYPAIQQLDSYWAAKRPGDYNMTPWGGQSMVGTGGGANVASASFGGLYPSSGVIDPPTGTFGALCYWTATPGTAITAVDQAGGSSTSLSYYNYLVAIVPNRYTGSPPPYLFVRGGAPIPPGSTVTGVGGVVGPGGGTPPSSPW